MSKKIIGIGAMALAAMPAFATDLWDQQAAFHSSSAPSGFVNQTFSDFPTYSTYDVSDVIVGAGGWNVTSVSIEVIASSPTGILTMTQGNLNVFANSGSLPNAGNNPTTGTSVAITVTPDTNFTNVFFITASGLNLNLSAGEYWIGLSPSGAFATAGEGFEGYTTTNAAGANLQDSVENPGGAFALASGTNWGTLEADASQTAPVYGAIDIQGTVAAPEPVSMAFLGLGVFGLIARRRARS